MTASTPPKTSQFKPGESGNPSGRPKTPADILEVRKLNREEVERILNKHMAMTRDDAKAVIKDPSTTQMEVLVASILDKAILTGDHTRLSFLLDRLIGRVKETIEIDGRFSSLTLPTHAEALRVLQIDYALTPPIEPILDEEI